MDYESKRALLISLMNDFHREVSYLQDPTSNVHVTALHKRNISEIRSEILRVALEEASDVSAQ